MNRLKSHWRAKFAGGSSRLKDKTRLHEADDRSDNPTDTASSGKLSIVNSPSAEEHEGQRTVGDAESQNVNTQTADAPASGYENSCATLRDMLLIE